MAVISNVIAVCIVVSVVTVNGLSNKLYKNGKYLDLDIMNREPYAYPSNQYPDFSKLLPNIKDKFDQVSDGELDKISEEMKNGNMVPTFLYSNRVSNLQEPDRQYLPIEIMQSSGSSPSVSVIIAVVSSLYYILL